MTIQLSSDLNTGLAQVFGAQPFKKTQVIQKLWSGYGEIARYSSDLNGHAVIVKVAEPQASAKHPRGWNTPISHKRKLSSYLNERNFYQQYAKQTNEYCRVPSYLSSGFDDNDSWLIMEDLDHSGFNHRCEHGTLEVAKLGLRWLAHFHARFLQQPSENLWPIGSYWHLETRPDEWQAMPDGALKTHAQKIDLALNNAHYQTLVHGDAKLANFCFKSTNQDLAAVDFQYVGRGVGIKDVMYFLGSCFDEEDLFKFGDTLVNEYFDCLKHAVETYQQHINYPELEKEWRDLYAFAWADFERFLMGWMPTHYKLNNYSKTQTDLAISVCTQSG